MSDQDKTKRPVELAIQVGNSLGLKLNNPTENENSSKKSFLLKEFEKIEQQKKES